MKLGWVLLIILLLFGSICKSWDFVLKGFCWRVGDGSSTRFWTDCWLQSGAILRDLLTCDLPPDKEYESVKDVSFQDSSWRLENITPWLPNDMCVNVTSHLGWLGYFGRGPSNLEPISRWALSVRSSDSSIRLTNTAAPTVRWTAPSEDWIKWNLDGSVRDFGSASSGCVLRDNLGRWILGAVRNVGRSSITVAELWAFMDATNLSISRGDSRVWLESDSACVVNFIKHGVHLSHPALALLKPSGRICSLFSVLCQSHSSRRKLVADRIASSGYDKPLGLHLIPISPSFLSNYLVANLFGVAFPRGFV
ncbi:Ribonuclease H domain [Sesbania bispinosa]|nr:Ribonuclease H domain [Sesbania bispinosa]